MALTLGAAEFGCGLQAALAVPDPHLRLEKLAGLAQHRLDFLQTIQVDNALRKTAAASRSGFSLVRLALLASCTIDHLLPAIRVAGLRRQMMIEIHHAPYAQYRQQLFDPSSQLHRFAPDVILFSMTSSATVPNVSLGASATDADQALSGVVAELRELWRKARENFNAVILQQSFLDVSEPLFGSHERLVPGAPARVVARLNDLLADAVTQEGVLLLDIARAAVRDGIDAWFDVARWLQAKMEIAPMSAPSYGNLLIRLIAAQRGQSKKCLVLDLDDTLWGGVIGDDGLEGIVLGEGSVVGEAHLRLQRYARQLGERGIILAVCSKNDADIAEAAFRDHPEMILRPSDIAAFVVNWKDKVDNLIAISRQLNIGLDSLVFVDNNPAERARIRQSLPMVAVPELPADVMSYVRCIADEGYFEAVDFTTEDRHRARHYAENAERQVLRTASQSIDEFLRGLQMLVVFGPVLPVDVARATQLISKTNQFNTTNRRYTIEEFSDIASATNNITLQFRLLDRFGDNGLVSVMILRLDQNDSDVWEIGSWVMSCRVFGRQLEDEAMNIAVEAAVSRGARELHAEFVPTKKNGVISGLYESLGFSRLQQSPQPDDSCRWFLSLDAYVARSTFIDRQARSSD